jgi:hypothetical protein
MAAAETRASRWIGLELVRALIAAAVDVPIDPEDWVQIVKGGSP